MILSVFLDREVWFQGNSTLWFIGKMHLDVTPLRRRVRHLLMRNVLTQLIDNAYNAFKIVQSHMTH